MAARRAPHRLCLGCEQTCRAQVCKQCVELRDAILGACCICDCRGYARICGTGGPLRPGGADRPLRSVAADKTLRTGRTGRPLRSGRADSTRCTDRADRPLRPGGTNGTLRPGCTGRSRGAYGAGQSLQALSALRTGGPGRAGCTDCTGGALQPLHALRPRGTDRTGYTLDPLYALRPRRPLHILRRKDRRERRGTGSRAGRRTAWLCAAARILKTIHQKYPPSKARGRKTPAFHSMRARRGGERKGMCTFCEQLGKNLQQMGRYANIL